MVCLPLPFPQKIIRKARAIARSRLLRPFRAFAQGPLTPGLRMLRILQPGLLCPAPSVLASPAIGRQALKARRRAAQGGRSERREDLEPWEEAGVYENPEGVKQSRPYSIKPPPRVLPIRRKLTGSPESRRLFCGRDGRAPRSSLGGLGRDACGTAGLRMLRILQPGLLCPAPSMLASPALGTISVEPFTHTAIVACSAFSEPDCFARGGRCSLMVHPPSGRFLSPVRKAVR